MISAASRSQSFKEEEQGPSILERTEISVPGGVGSEEEEQIIEECQIWVVEHGLPAGEYMYELTDPETRPRLDDS